MAVTETNIKSSLHLHSNSLPFTPHPLVSQIEDSLNILKSSESTSTVLTSLAYNKLNGTQDLHDSIDKLHQLHFEQLALAQECNEKCVDDQLEGSLRILDIYNIAKDCLLLSKENIHELQSVIRRRNNDTRFKGEGVKYMALRKNIKKEIRKALLNLQAKKNELMASSSNNKNHNSSAMFGILKEAESVTLCSLEHLLQFIYDPEGRAKYSRWSAISKLMHSKRAVHNSLELETNEFKKVDSDLQSLIIHDPLSTETFQSHMEDLDMHSRSRNRS